MINIPRRSEFSLTDAEKDMIRKKNEEALNEYIEKIKVRGIQITEEKAYELLIINLFYDIGMQDYWIYRDSNNNLPEKEFEKIVKEYIKKRALDSAVLQVLIEDAKMKGYDVNKILHPEIGEVFEYKAHIDYSLDMKYHGTSEELDPNQIGKADESGVYYIRDGISYWTDYEEAKNYSYHINREQRERGLMGGNIYSRGIEDGTLCATITETHGGVFAMCQDELIRLNQKGVRYIFSAGEGRKDVLDIENFADFVKKRDECLVKIMEKFNLRLPKKEESLSEYFSSINDLKNDKKIQNNKKIESTREEEKLN